MFGLLRRCEGSTASSSASACFSSCPPGRAPPLGAVLELRARPLAPRGPETGFDERRWLARRGIHVVLEGAGWRVVGRRGGIGGVADRLRAHVARLARARQQGRAAGARRRRGARRGRCRPERASRCVPRVRPVPPDGGLRSERRLRDRWGAGAHVACRASRDSSATSRRSWRSSPTCSRSAGSRRSSARGSRVASRRSPGSPPGRATAGTSSRWERSSCSSGRRRRCSSPASSSRSRQLRAIFVLVPRLQRTARGYPVPARLVDVTAVAIACGLVDRADRLAALRRRRLCGPFPPTSLAEPAMPVVLGLRARPRRPPRPCCRRSRSRFAWLAGLGAAWLAFCARLFAGLPLAQIRSGVALAALAAVVAARRVGLVRAGSRARRGRTRSLHRPRARWASAWRAPTGSAAAAAPEGLRVTFLDVGQGDAALLQVAAGRGARRPRPARGPCRAAAAPTRRSRARRRRAHASAARPRRGRGGRAPDASRRHAFSTPGLPSDDSADEAAALAAARERQRPGRPRARRQRLPARPPRLRVLWPDGPVRRGRIRTSAPSCLLASFGETDVFLPADAESTVTDAARAARGRGAEGRPPRLRGPRPRSGSCASCGRGGHHLGGRRERLRPPAAGDGRGARGVWPASASSAPMSTAASSSRPTASGLR